MENNETSEFAFREGDDERLLDKAFETSEHEETTSPRSAAGKNEADNTQSPEGDNTQGAKLPFHKDPEVANYLSRTLNKEREAMRVEFDRKLNESIAKAKEEISQGATAKEALPEKVPRWFGGDQGQWDEFVGFLNQRFNPLAERLESIGQMERATVEATNYLKSEITAIENDPVLNPQGARFNRELADRLISTVIENDLVDSQGHWNYRAGWRLLQQQRAAAPRPAGPSLKTRISGATSSGSKAPEGKPAFATREDFKKKKPW